MDLNNVDGMEEESFFGLTRKEVEECISCSKKYYRSQFYGARNQTAITLLKYEEILLNCIERRIKEVNSK